MAATTENKIDDRIARRDKNWIECDAEQKLERLRTLLHDCLRRETRNSRKLDALMSHSHDAIGTTVISMRASDEMAFYEPPHFDADGKSYM